MKSVPPTAAIADKCYNGSKRSIAVYMNSKQNFEPAIMQFKLMFPNNYNIITVPESPMFNAPEAAEVTEPRLELVRQAGKKYAQTDRIDEKLLTKLCSPMIPEDVYVAICNKAV